MLTAKCISSNYSEKSFTLALKSGHNSSGFLRLQIEKHCSKNTDEIEILLWFALLHLATEQLEDWNILQTKTQIKNILFLWFFISGSEQEFSFVPGFCEQLSPTHEVALRVATKQVSLELTEQSYTD